MKYCEASEYVLELTSARPSDVDASSNEKAEPVELSIYCEAREYITPMMGNTWQGESGVSEYPKSLGRLVC